MAFGHSSAADPFHLRELAEALAERFEKFNEIRARFGEPISQKKPRFVGRNLSETANDLAGPAPASSAEQAV